MESSRKLYRKTGITTYNQGKTAVRTAMISGKKPFKKVNTETHGTTEPTVPSMAGHTYILCSTFKFPMQTHFLITFHLPEEGR